MKTYRIATIPGDGIGKEVIPAGQQALAALAATAQWGAQLLHPGQPLRWLGLATDTCFVIPLMDEAAPPIAGAATVVHA